MTYLIAKYAIIFLATGVLGFLLGRWWVRRSFVDVTESYGTLSKAASAAPWDKLWGRLDNLPQPDLEPVRHGLAELDTRVQAIPVPPQPEPVDLAPVNERIEQVEALIAKLPKPEKAERVDLHPVIQRMEGIETLIANLPQPEKPQRVDLQPVTQRMDGIEALIANLPQPEKPQRVDLQPVTQRMEGIEALIANLPQPEKAERVDLNPINHRIGHLETLIGNLPKPEKAQTVDLNPINQRMQRIEALIANLPKHEPAEQVDLDPVNRRMDRIDEALRAIKIPAAPELGPVADRLHIIEGRLIKLTSQKERKKDTVVPGPILLKSAKYGTKDDLKRISGVGPKLERLLNRNGVYYFWQVADWNAKDIKTMDNRLAVFKGRISRDSWVRQAKTLSKRSKVQRPTSSIAAAPAG